jgi:hypothetical protein
MADDPKDSAYKELNIFKDINSEVERLGEMNRKRASIELGLVNLQREYLDANKNTVKNFKEQDELLKAKESLLKLIRDHTSEESKPYKEALNTLNEQLKVVQKLEATRAQEEKDSKKVSDAWDSIEKKMGGVITKGQKIKELFDLAPEILLAEGLVYIFKSVLQTFVSLDEAAAEFRKSVGITRDSSAQLETMARNTALDYWKLGVTAKDAYESIKAIADSLGSTQFATQGVVDNMAIFQAQLGVAAKTSADFLKTMAMVGGSTLDGQKNMLYFAQYMSSAAGTPLDAVMQDVASASQNSYQFISKNPLELIKAAVEAKRMGTSLTSAANSASSLLDFTQSVRNEMEASVLVGKSINLQHARELAYRRDIRGLNQEILKIAQQTDFQNLDPFQQKAVADALGKSVGEVMTMVQSAREQDNLMRHMTKEQRDQYELYQKALSANQDTADSMAEQAQHALTAISNQAALKSISLAWSSIMANVGRVLLPLIAATLTTIAKILDKIPVKIVAGIGALLVPITFVSTVLYTIGKTILFIGKALFQIGKYAEMRGVIRAGTTIARMGKNILSIFQWEKIAGFFSRIGSWLLNGVRLGGRFAGWIGRLGVGLVEWLNPISKIIAAFSVGFGIGTWLNKFKFVSEAIQQDWIWVFQLGDWIAAESGKIYNAVKKPFVAAWEWLKDTFLGKSPSQLGLMIVEGILSVETILIQALLSPFMKAWELIKHVPFISHFLGHGDLTKGVHPNVALHATAQRAKSDIDIKRTQKGAATPQESANMDVVKAIGELRGDMQGLRQDMKDGKLTATVYIDSQKLDSAMGRRLAYTGHLG